MNTKARLTFNNGTYYLEIAPKEHKPCSEDEVRQFILTYNDPKYYNSEASFLSHDFEGEVLAYANEDDELTVTSPFILEKLFQTSTKYITVVEFAERYGKQRNIIARFCRQGRIPGVIQKEHRWLIPENAPYPKHGHIKEK